MGGNTLVTKSMFEDSSTDCTGGSRGQTSVEKQLFYTLKKQLRHQRQDTTMMKLYKVKNTTQSLVELKIQNMSSSEEIVHSILRKVVLW